MRKGIFLLTLMVITFSNFSFSDNHLFSLKISGGMSRVYDGGDLKKWFNGEKAYFDWLGKQQNYSTKSNYPFKQDEPEGNFEVIFKPLNYIGVSVGLGYTRRIWSSSSEVYYNHGGNLGYDKIELSSKNELNVFPVTLSLIVSVPYKFLRANLFAGGGYYYANLKFNMESKYFWQNFPDRENYKHHYTSNLTTHSEGAGFHGGIGLEVKIISHLSFSIDAFFRNVKLGDIKGELKWNEILEWSGYKKENSGSEKNQTLWFGSFKVDGNQFERAIFSGEKPSLFENARPFNFNLNGTFIKAGIVLSF
jgi:hypothetical protein